MEGKIYSPEKGKFVSVKTKHGQKVLKIYNEHLLGGDKHHNCAYCKIVNPKTGKMVSTYGQTGGRVIKSYNMIGGVTYNSTKYIEKFENLGNFIDVIKELEQERQNLENNGQNWENKWKNEIFFENYKFSKGTVYKIFYESICKILQYVIKIDQYNQLTDEYNQLTDQYKKFLKDKVITNIEEFDNMMTYKNYNIEDYKYFISNISIMYSYTRFIPKYKLEELKKKKEQEKEQQLLAKTLRLQQAREQAILQKEQERLQKKQARLQKEQARLQKEQEKEERKQEREKERKQAREQANAEREQARKQERVKKLGLGTKINPNTGERYYWYLTENKIIYNEFNQAIKALAEKVGLETEINSNTGKIYYSDLTDSNTKYYDDFNQAIKALAEKVGLGTEINSNTGKRHYWDLTDSKTKYIDFNQAKNARNEAKNAREKENYNAHISITQNHSYPPEFTNYKKDLHNKLKTEGITVNKISSGLFDGTRKLYYNKVDKKLKMEKKGTFYSEKKIYPVEVNKTFNNNNKIRLINTNTHKPYIIKRGDKIKKGTEKYIFSNSNIVNNI